MLDGVLLVQHIYQIHAAESAEGYQAGERSRLGISQCPHYSKDQNQLRPYFAIQEPQQLISGRHEWKNKVKGKCLYEWKDILIRFEPQPVSWRCQTGIFKNHETCHPVPSAL